MKILTLSTAGLFASLSHSVCSVGASPLTSASATQQLSPYPRIVLKGEHEIWKTENPLAAYYIRASAGARLDLTDFRLVHNGEVITPNAVSVSLPLPRSAQDRRDVDDPHSYQSSRPVATNVYVLDRVNLEPAPGPQYSESRAPFPGFHYGDCILLLIGRLTEDDTGRKSFSVLWIAKLLVGSPNDGGAADAGLRPGVFQAQWSGAADLFR